jgi:hypothetical protein
MHRKHVLSAGSHGLYWPFASSSSIHHSCVAKSECADRTKTLLQFSPDGFVCSGCEELCHLIVTQDLTLGFGGTHEFMCYIKHTHNPKFNGVYRQKRTRDCGKVCNNIFLPFIMFNDVGRYLNNFNPFCMPFVHIRLTSKVLQRLIIWIYEKFFTPKILLPSCQNTH